MSFQQNQHLNLLEHYALLRDKVFSCVKPSVLARSGWVRAQVAMDVYPLCPVIKPIMLSPRIDFNGCRFPRVIQF